MHVRKLKSGSWNVEAYAGYDPETGKAFKKSFTGKDLRDVKMLAAEWEKEHRAFVDRVTLRAAAEAYLRQNRRTLSPSTLQGYRAILRNLPDWLLGLPCHALSAAHIQRFVSEARVSPKTIKNRLGFVSAVLKSQDITPPIMKSPRADLPDLNIPDSETVKKILAAADGELWICIMLAATGPLRAGEIAALSMEDIDFTTGTVHVKHSLVYGEDHAWHLKAPKTKTSDRYIDMPLDLIEAIERQGYVTHWTPKGIYNRFQTLLRHEGIPPFRFHDLRHFCISELLLQGIDEVSVSERSGHTDHATMQRYIHVLGNRRKEVTQRVRDHFGALFT